LFINNFALFDTSKIHPEPVEGRILRLCAFETRSKSPFDKLRVISRWMPKYEVVFERFLSHHQGDTHGMQQRAQPGILQLHL
jgi:hypothetical protein